MNVNKKRRMPKDIKEDQEQEPVYKQTASSGAKLNRIKQKNEKIKKARAEEYDDLIPQEVYDAAEDAEINEYKREILGKDDQVENGDESGSNEEEKVNGENSDGDGSGDEE